jgi:hypothetical protein
MVDTGVRAAGKDGTNGNDGQTPYIGYNGNWWLGQTDTGVKAAGKDGTNGTNGLTPYIGSNGNWWIGQTDTGVKAAGKDGIDGTNGTDGLTPYIGTNGNWWIGQTDLGVKAAGKDGINGTNGTNGLTPHIGTNGNWWIGQTDTGVAATSYIESGSSSTANIPIISIEQYQGIYYWIQILNGERTWLTDEYGNKLPVSGKDGKDGKDGISPIIRIDMSGYWVISYDGGITFVRITDSNGSPVKASGECECQQFFRSVQVVDNTLVMVLIDGTVIVFHLNGGGGNVTPTPSLPINPNAIFPNPRFVIKYVPGRGYVLYVYMPGMKDPYTGEWIDYSDGSDGKSRNFYVDIDDDPQIIDIDEPEDEEGKRMKTDLVFLVDNSGSMSEEADYVANCILNWSQWLKDSGQDVQFGVVGFSVSGTINGALDLTTVERLSAYLNYNGRTGTDRTTSFTDTKMRDAAANYTVSDECGVMALRYADANMTFRSDSYRAYAIFTDEPNQPNQNMNYSVTWLDPAKGYWNSDRGMICTVYSASDSFTETIGAREHYKWLADYTGGYYQTTNTTLSGFDYKQVDFANSVAESDIIIIDLDNSMLGNTHNVKLTYISDDNRVVAQQSYVVDFVVSQ